MATLMVTMLAAFAEFERSLIRERQSEGIAAARAKGVYKGRKRSLTAEQVAELRAKAAAPGAVKAHSSPGSTGSAGRRSTSTSDSGSYDVAALPTEHAAELRKMAAAIPKPHSSSDAFKFPRYWSLTAMVSSP